MQSLPQFDTSRTTWIEITKMDHQHGGLGWEFGTCLWSPTKNKAGNDFYAIMKEPVRGDLVLHFLEDKWPDGKRDARFCGYSRISVPCYETADQPPVNSAWGFSDRYFRIDLSGFSALDKPIPIRILRKEYEQDIRDEKKLSVLSHYPFAVRKDGIRLSQGRYLARCTQMLYSFLIEVGSLVVDEAENSESGSTSSYAERSTYREQRRALKEQMRFVRNPKLAKKAKEQANYTCAVCGLEPVVKYGDRGKRLLDCHHLIPVSSRDLTDESTWDLTLDDVSVLCANCHRLAHSGKQLLSIASLKALV